MKLDKATAERLEEEKAESEGALLELTSDDDDEEEQQDEEEGNGDETGDKSEKKAGRKSLVDIFRKSMKRKTTRKSKALESILLEGKQSEEESDGEEETEEDDEETDVEQDLYADYPDGIQVLLTFPTGFEGSHILKKLVSEGTDRIRKIRVCVDGNEQIAAVRKITGEDERVEMRMLDSKNLDSILRDIQVVIFDGPQIPGVKPTTKGKELDNYAVEYASETEKFMLACETAGVIRVLLLSSTCTFEHARPWGGTRSLGESDWNNVTDTKRLIKISRDPLEVWRLMAVEKTALSFAKRPESNIKFTSILPSLVTGPLLLDHRPASLDIFFRLLEGNLSYVVNYSYPIVDVRDVATAFYLAIFSSRSVGRRIALTSSRSVHYREYVNVVCDDLANRVDDSSLAEKLGKKRPKVLAPIKAKLQAKFDHTVAMSLALEGKQPKFSSSDFEYSIAHLTLGMKRLIGIEDTLLATGSSVAEHLNIGFL